MQGGLFSKASQVAVVRPSSRNNSTIAGLRTRLLEHAAAGRTAIIETSREEASYSELLAGADAVACRLHSEPSYTRGGRVAFLAPPGIDYVRTLLGVWQAGGVAVPLCTTHPEEELRYAITEADACMVAASGETFVDRLAPIARTEGRAFFALGDATAPSGSSAWLHDSELAEPALIIFTSGTTGRPKGVVLTHGNLAAHTASLVDAWGWSHADRILHILPLHHLHGLGNKLLCALWSGASVAFSPPSPREVWARLGRAEEDGLTLFMAVPTNYALLY